MPLWFQLSYYHLNCAKNGAATFTGQLCLSSWGNPDYASNPNIKWNFTKFLIDRKGRVVARFEPVVTPQELESEIEALL